MAGVYKGLTIELGADSSALDSALKKSERAASSLQREMKKVSKSLTFDGTDTAAYDRQMKLLGDSVDNAKKKLDMLNKAMANPDNQGRMTAEQQSKLRYEIEATEKEIEQYNAQMSELKARHEAANASMSATKSNLSDLGDKVESAGRKMRTAGVAMTAGLTVPITAGFKKSVDAAVELDTALTGVRKTVDGSEEDYQALRDAAVEFSKTSSVSAAELLDIEALGAQLGFGHENLEELKEFAEVVAGLDIATNLDAETAAMQLAQFANIMSMSHDEVGNFASSLIDLGNHFSTTEADIMNMSMRLAGAGATIGMSEADVLGLATALSSVGINAEAGGTAISTVMSQIDKDVATGSENLAKWAEVAGMSAEEFAAAWNKDALGAFQDVIAGMADGGENLSVLLDELGVTSLRQTDTLKRLANAADLLPDAVKRANSAYAENTALAAEVSNFNDSLAVKFEMVRNRVTAVAAEIGAPLADAMLAALDAAEPLFQAVEDGARAFAEMSEGEQRAVIQAVAVIAALGPALTLFGSLASNAKVLGGALSTLAQLFAKLDVATGAAGKGFRQVADASGNMVQKATASSVAFGALKGAAIGLAVAGIAVLVKALVDYKQRSDDFAKATTGLKDALDILDGPLSSVGSGVDALSSSIGGYAGGVDEAIRKQAEFAGKVKDSYSETMESAAVAKHYSDRIAELTANFDGSADQLAALKAAVDGYNAATGSSIEIIDETTGKLSMETPELQRNTEAWIANAKAKAAQDLMADAVSEQVRLEGELAEVEEKVALAERNLQEARDSGDTGKILEAEAALASFKQQQSDLQALLDSNAQAQDRLNAQMEGYTKAAMLASQTTDDFRTALANAEGTDFDTFAEGLGTSAEDLSSALTGAGITVQDFSRVGSAAFSALYTSADGDMAKIKAALDMIDAEGLDPKTLEIGEDGALYVEGKLVDLDNYTIDGKTVQIDAVDNATGIIDSIAGKLRSLQDAAVTVGVSAAGQAAGGLTRVPISALRRNAQGGLAGIVSSPTLTNVGLVGEAGAEAIIPLSNRRYVGTFAQAVADRVGGGQTVHNYNITLDYKAGDDANKIVRDLGFALRTSTLMEA